MTQKIQRLISKWENELKRLEKECKESFAVGGYASSLYHVRYVKKEKLKFRLSELKLAAE